MSAIIERFLLCDANGCHATFGIDKRHAMSTITILRREAKREGWSQRGTSDYCERCTVHRRAGKERT